MRRSLVASAVFTFAFATLALAGGKEKCNMELGACLRETANYFKDRGWVGIEMEAVEGTKQVAIRKVIEGSPAEKAGIKAGDIILSVNGVAHETGESEAIKAVYKGFKPGALVKFSVQREGQPVEVAVTLGEMTDDFKAMWVGRHAMEHLNAEASEAKTEPKS